MQEMSKTNQTKIIGLTGNIASGKSSVAHYLEKQGYFVIDADQLTHQLYENDETFKEQVIKLLGKNILSHQKIDKAKIGQIVFNDKDKLKALEKLVHPRVRDNAFKIINQLNKDIVIYEVPLLFEASVDKDCFKTIFVQVDKQMQLNRLQTRNKLTTEQALARINSQVKQEEKINKADYVIVNNTNLDDLYKQVDTIMNQIKKEIEHE